MAGVFINYRRADTQGWAMGLYRDLAGKFGEERVGMDVETVGLGESFVARIEETLSRCDAMIVLIGPQWLTASGENRPRLQDPEDWVRLEIEAAFKSKMRVVPVLVDGGEMPRSAELPETLRDLARMQAVAISPGRYDDDVDRLIHHIEKLTGDKRLSKPVDAAPARNHPAEELAPGASKAFFSYSRADSEFALKLAGDLRSAGADIWVDQFDIPLGVRWDDAIAEALDNCSRHLVVLSPAAVASQNVKDEIAYALDEGKEIVPVIHQECKVPYRLRRWQRIDLNANYEAGTAQILGVLGVDGAQAGHP